jgi:hypothetical protein
MPGSKSSDLDVRPNVPNAGTGHARDAAPAQALTMTVHAMPTADVGEGAAALSPAVRRVGRLKMLLVMLACAAPVLASYLSYFVIRPEGRTNYAALLEPTRDWPANLPLTDNNGAAVTPASLRGQWLLVAMGDAACDAACEKRLFTQRQLREMLGRERDRVDKIFLVLDGAPLKPALAASVAADPTIRVLRAPRDGVAAWLSLPPQQVDQHLFVADPIGPWMMRAPVELDPAKFKRDLDRLLRASASWDRAGRDVLPPNPLSLPASPAVPTRPATTPAATKP